VKPCVGGPRPLWRRGDPGPVDQCRGTRLFRLSLTFARRLLVCRAPRLPDDIYHILHRSFAHIQDAQEHRECGCALIDTSMEAILKSRDVLKRLRDDGF